MKNNRKKGMYLPIIGFLLGAGYAAICGHVYSLKERKMNEERVKAYEEEKANSELEKIKVDMRDKGYFSDYYDLRAARQSLNLDSHQLELLSQIRPETSHNMIDSILNSSAYRSHIDDIGKYIEPANGFAFVRDLLKLSDKELKALYNPLLQEIPDKPYDSAYIRGKGEFWKMKRRAAYVDYHLMYHNQRFREDMSNLYMKLSSKEKQDLLKFLESF